MARRPLALIALTAIALTGCAANAPSAPDADTPSPAVTSAAPDPMPSPSSSPAPEPSPATTASPTADDYEREEVELDGWLTVTIPSAWRIVEGASNSDDISDHAVLNEAGDELIQLTFQRDLPPSGPVECFATVAPAFVLEQRPVPEALPGVPAEQQAYRVSRLLQISNGESFVDPGPFAYDVRSALVEQTSLLGPACAMPVTIYPPTGGVIGVKTSANRLAFETLEEAVEYANSDEFRMIEAVLDSARTTL